MAVTANGTPYVESSDLVANYPGVSLALANHIDGLDGGKVLQVVYAYSVSNITTTSTSYVTTGIVGTITPSSATSKILVIASSQFSVSTSNIGYMTIFRGTVAGTNLGPTNGFALITTASSSTPQSLQTAVWLDSPSTTSAQAYTIGFKTNGGSVTVNNANYGTITLIEVAA